jgi:glycosyltransferase involved in cell wall biosynthesis
MKHKLIRITTIPESLDKLLENQLAYMNQYFEVIAVSSKSNLLKIIAEKQKVRTIGINMSRKITPLCDFVSLCRMFYLFKKEKPLIVHSHTPKAGLISMLASWLLGIPYRIHTVAGLPLLEASGFKRFLLNFTEKITYFCATHVLPNSFALSTIIKRENLCNYSKLYVINNGSSNGINLEYFNPKNFNNELISNLKKEYNLHNKFIYIFVGRIVKDKGINELVKAFSFLSNENPQIKLIILGVYEKHLDPINNEIFSEIENNNNIINFGHQNDIRPFLLMSDVLILPSYREGFPNVVMQAGAMNLPCIVSNINGCNEIIQDNYNGLIIEAKNYKSLYSAMKNLLYNKDLFNTLKIHARNNIQKKYDQEEFWNYLLAFYENILQKNGYKL